MAAKRKPLRARRSKREALVHSHLEKVSRDLLEQHPEVVREFIGRNAGIYALYKRNTLYYVGLATKLSGRLKTHQRDRHGKSWDRFSIYLTIKDQHLKEIECLLLQIARPRGNKIGGKPTGSKDMRRRVLAAIRQRQRHIAASLFDRGRASDVRKRTASSSNEASQLTRLLPAGAKLRATNKGKVYRASVRPNGRVRFQNKYFSSLSAAASTALKRPANGWSFWRIERGKGHWVRLAVVRKAGTPIYPK